MSSYSFADGGSRACESPGMSGLGKRIKSARELRNVSQEALGKVCGVSRAAVAQWEAETSAPTMDKLEPICEKLDADPVWLLTGKHGPKDKTNGQVGVAMVYVPEYDVRVAAGGGFAISEETKRDVWPFSRGYIENQLRLQTTHLVVLEVQGDSMEPTLRTGDRVMVNLSDKRVSQPGIFVLWDGDGTVVKRLEIVPNSKPLKIKRISDNPLHHTYDVVAEDTTIVGRVVWHARRM